MIGRPFRRPWEQDVTCCIAALAQDSIVLVADKMVGTSVIQGEPLGLLKMTPIHRDWWALFSGDTPLAGDLFSRLKAAFPTGSLSIHNVDAYLSTTIYEKWENDADREILAKEGYNSATFRDEAPKKLPDAIYREIRDRRKAYSLNASVIVAGFDDEGKGHILSCHGYSYWDKQFVVQNHDMVGYYAIGSGADGALWMMSYKDVGPLMRVAKVAYYAVEGKYYGELGAGVGECTDLIVIRHREKALLYNTKLVNAKIIPMCYRNRPRKIKKKDRKRIERLKAVEWGDLA